MKTFNFMEISEVRRQSYDRNEATETGNCRLRVSAFIPPSIELFHIHHHIKQLPITMTVNRYVKGDDRHPPRRIWTGSDTHRKNTSMRAGNCHIQRRRLGRQSIRRVDFDVMRSGFRVEVADMDHAHGGLAAFQRASVWLGTDPERIKPSIMASFRELRASWPSCLGSRVLPKMLSPVKTTLWPSIMPRTASA